MSEKCCECGGLGHIVVERPPLMERIECEWCDGTGEIDEDDTDRQGNDEGDS